MSLLMLQLNIQFAPTSPSNASVCTHMRSCFVCCMQGVFATTNKFLRRWFEIHCKSPHVKSLSPLKLTQLLLRSPIVAIIEKKANYKLHFLWLLLFLLLFKLFSIVSALKGLPYNYISHLNFLSMCGLSLFLPLSFSLECEPKIQWWICVRGWCDLPLQYKRFVNFIVFGYGSSFVGLYVACRNNYLVTLRNCILPPS